MLKDILAFFRPPFLRAACSLSNSGIAWFNCRLIVASYSVFGFPFLRSPKKMIRQCIQFIAAGSLTSSCNTVGHSATTLQIEVYRYCRVASVSRALDFRLAARAHALFRQSCGRVLPHVSSEHAVTAPTLRWSRPGMALPCIRHPPSAFAHAVLLHLPTMTVRSCTGHTL